MKYEVTKPIHLHLPSFLAFFRILHPNDIVRCNADKLFRPQSSIWSIKICGKEYWFWDTKSLTFSLRATKFSWNGHYICYFQSKKCLFSRFFFLCSIANTFSFLKTRGRILEHTSVLSFNKRTNQFYVWTWINSKSNPSVWLTDITHPRKVD